MESTSPSLEDCLHLLRGERDEQKLAGLLLATKLSRADDQASLLKVYKAVGARFLHRLLTTGKGAGSYGGGINSVDYLKLSVTVLAGFCRVPEIASSLEIISEVPLVAEIIPSLSDSTICEECYELLVFVASASDNGIIRILESGSIQLLARHISGLHHGSRSLELAVRLLQVILNKIPLETIEKKYPSGMSSMVACLSRQFTVLQNALKFDAMHVLATLLSSKNALFHEALRDLSRENWAAYVRVGVMEILQNRIVCSKKLQGLLLLDSIMYILGESWLLEDTELNDVKATLPVDKFLLLVLESARVEVAVFLNELAFLKYENSKSSSTAESIISKQQDLGILFSLIEKIIKLISSSCTLDGTFINEEIVAQMISGINETIMLVLDFLQDAKDHCYNKGDDLLAAVRIVGSYLAETPFACKEKVRDLLQYMLSIESEDESSPFYSICFLLPMLCQITMEIDGRQSLASFGGLISIVECLVKLLRESRTSVEHSGTIFLACDTILNLLLNRKELEGQIEGSQFVRLLHELSFWAESSRDPSVIMMAATICTVVFDLTSEENLLNHPDFNRGTLDSLSQLIVRSLSMGFLDDDANGHNDLHEIVSAGYDQWALRYPFVKDAVERARNA